MASSFHLKSLYLWQYNSKQSCIFKKNLFRIAPCFSGMNNYRSQASLTEKKMCSGHTERNYCQCVILTIVGTFILSAICKTIRVNYHGWLMYPINWNQLIERFHGCQRCTHHIQLHHHLLLHLHPWQCHGQLLYNFWLLWLELCRGGESHG